MENRTPGRVYFSIKYMSKANKKWLVIKEVIEPMTDKDGKFIIDKSIISYHKTGLEAIKESKRLKKEHDLKVDKRIKEIERGA